MRLASFGIVAVILLAAAPASSDGAKPEAPSPGVAPALLRCAVIARPAQGEGTAAVAALLDSALGATGSVTLLERQEVDRVLAEQQLQALSAPEGAGPRVTVGKILKADLLVVLEKERTSATPGEANAAPRAGGGEPAAVRVVVCETRGGLRLCVRTIPLRDGPEAAARRVVAAVTWAVSKHRQAVAEVVAVPPFVSDDLGFEFAHLQAAYARMVEQVLLEREGLLVVELAEADALAREAALAGGGPLRRRLPLYLLGRYRHAGGADPRVRLSLELRRGGELAVATEKADLRPAAAADALREAAGALVAGATGAARPAAAPDPAADARALAERATVFADLANWREALALFEASLLVQPDELEVRRQAVIACGQVARRQIHAAGEADVEQMRRGLAIYFRGMDHLETFLRTADDLAKYRREGRGDFVGGFLHATNGWKVGGYPTKELLDVLAAGRERQLETMLRIARMRARAGRGDDAVYAMYAVSGLPEPRQYQLLYDLLRELQDLPGAPRRVYGYATHGNATHVLLQGEGRKFLDRAAALENPDVRSAAEALKARLPEFAAAAEWHNAQFERLRAPASRPADESAGPSEALLRKLPPEVEDYRCTAAGSTADVFWAPNRGDLLLMKEKGQVKTAFSPGRLNTGFNSVCYDGKYVWAYYTAHMENDPVLVVLDPASERVWKITAADGLPAPRPDATPGHYVSNVGVVAPLGPGRACVTGTMGHTWVAIVSFDPDRPDGPRTVKVILEARAAQNPEKKEQWRDAGVAFVPGYAFAVTEPAEAGKAGRRRVLIGRDGWQSGNLRHPLVIDAEAGTVAVADGEGPWQEGEGAAVGPDGALYWATYIGPTSAKPSTAPTLWRMGFPAFAREAAAQRVYEGPMGHFCLAFHRGRVLLLAERFWAADSVKGPFRPLRGTFFEGSGIVEPRNGLFLSHHYGLIVHARRGPFEFLELPGVHPPSDKP